LLADGSEGTAVELAERLGTSRNEILIAARKMLADGTLQVARYVAASRGGRGARVFVCASASQAAVFGSHALWPEADPVVTGAFDAIARLR
jgi:predicted ArsR family transcriptional regulator